jgi:nicotinamide-nucleotide amidase
MTVSEEIDKLICTKGLTLGTVESATGGLISHLITNIIGSADYYKGSITCYSPEIKTRLIGVNVDTLNKFGAVSREVTSEMAFEGRKVLRCDICIADTGFAGPGAGLDKPAGLFYIALSHQNNTISKKYLFNGNRVQNKESAAEATLNILRDYLLNLP